MSTWPLFAARSNQVCAAARLVVTPWPGVGLAEIEGGIGVAASGRQIATGLGITCVLPRLGPYPRCAQTPKNYMTCEQERSD